MATPRCPNIGINNKKVLWFVFLMCGYPGLPSPVKGQTVPTAKQIIHRHIDAMGSEMLLNTLTSFRLTGQYQGDEMTVCFHKGVTHWYTAKRKNAYWFNRNGEFWARNNEKWKLRDDYSVGYPSRFISLPMDGLLWLDDKNLKIENRGKHRLGEHETWWLHFESADGKTAERYFDQKSGLLLQTVDKDGNSNWYRYSELDGYLFATTIGFGSIDNAERAGITLDKIELEPDFDETDFEMPAFLKAIDKSDGH